MDSALYVFVEDLRAEGVRGLLDRASAYGVRGVAVAAAYHQARDVTPHGASRLTLRRDGVHFPPPDDLFDGLRLTPPVQPGAQDRPLDELRRACADRGMRLHGWAVFLHNATLGLAHPDVTVENCFGDRGSPADLCPSHPDVRAYAVALARAVARQGVDTVVAESLHFGAFAYERCVVALGPMDAFLFGLCFCAHCMRRAADLGVNAEVARQECARIVGGVLDGDPPAEGEVTRAALTAYAGPETVAYARARSESVTSLVGEVAAAVTAEGARLTFMDATGAAKGHAHGLPSAALAAHDSWQLGIDLVALGDLVPSFAVLGYARDPARVADDVAAYRRSVGKNPELRVVLRPGAPDTDSADRLAAKVRVARTAGAGAADFYAYGLAPFEALGRITDALA
ncbi:hypothetical protein [Microbispora bryophytorum]|uniref:Alanine-rich protein n=1 Tax=Microbispora bryophytorum TaxID=1460882 RepID=A0A8H9H1E0_9ACTN|nr:hypothetical protein [Microbispora bryophytorum]MBD3136386.1 hypothetical protein [Microbispora bryophytorum]TQS08100.1 hypothetical protein FLX07_09975 [Microbispora bryophytorum]GGO06017.1 hypothetical protein GCM10011574_18320 [Microbispora bryophytorum]